MHYEKILPPLPIPPYLGTLAAGQGGRGVKHKNNECADETAADSFKGRARHTWSAAAGR